MRQSHAAEIQSLINDLHRLYGDVDALELRLVERIRAMGGSWSDVGQAFGISRQAAIKRFGRRDGGNA